MNPENSQELSYRGKRGGDRGDLQKSNCNQLFKLEAFQGSDTGREEATASRAGGACSGRDVGMANTRNAAPKSKPGIALNCLKNQWPYLTAYLQDRRIELILFPNKKYKVR